MQTSAGFQNPFPSSANPRHSSEYSGEGKSRCHVTHFTDSNAREMFNFSQVLDQPGRGMFMNLREWSESEVEYGRKVLNSGLAGARSGRETFLKRRPLTPFLSEAV